MIYVAGGYHDPMFGGHANPTNNETKGALREVDFHAGVDYLCIAVFEGEFFNTVGVICSRVLGGSCGGSCFVMNEGCGGVFELIDRLV